MTEENNLYFVISINYKIYEINIVPAANYMFKAKNRSTRTGCEICSKLAIKTSERC